MKPTAYPSVPFNILPPAVLHAITNRIRGLGRPVANAFPYLEINLKQAEIGIRKEEYGAIMATLFITYLLLGLVVFYLLLIRISPKSALVMSLTAALILAFLIVVQLSLYPSMVVARRVRDIERNLMFALRTMLVEIKSGVSLFDAMGVIARGDYGAVSHAFSKAVEEIQTGSLEDEALSSIAMQNPSPFFRKAIWQMVNGMKAGADVSVVLTELVNTIGKEQRIEINRYGGSLRVLSLIYMMIGVIIPAMGITFLIVLSSFPQIKIQNEMFWGMLGMVAFMQFMFLGFIKSKRPNLIG